MRRGCVSLIVILLLIVLVVALLWARFVWPEAKRQGTSQTIYIIEEALERFHRDEDMYPPGENRDLMFALIEGENRHGKQYIDANTVILVDEQFADFWKTPQRFEIGKDGKPVITSAGADGAFGTGDEVTSERVRRTLEPPPSAR